MTKITTIIAAAALVFQATAFAIPAPAPTHKVVNSTSAVNSKGNGTVSTTGFFYAGLMNVYADWYSLGSLVQCTLMEFDTCYGLTMNGYGRVSTIEIEAIPWSSGPYSFTAYTGDFCDGNYFRWSGNIQRGQKILYDKLPATFNDNVRTVRLARYLTSNVDNAVNPGWDPKVLSSNCRLIRQ